MAKFKVKMQDGQMVEVEGRKFSHYINNVRFWFFYHPSVEGHMTTVSHYPSGWRVTDVSPTTIAACLNDRKRAAKMALDTLVERVGADKAEKVLRAAE